MLYMATNSQDFPRSFPAVTWKICESDDDGHGDGHTNPSDAARLLRSTISRRAGLTRLVALTARIEIDQFANGIGSGSWGDGLSLAGRVVTGPPEPVPREAKLGLGRAGGIAMG